MSLLQKFGEPITLKRTPAGLQLAFSAPFVDGNVIALDINGSAIPPVAFQTDSDTTLAALATAIAAMPGVDSAVAQSPIAAGGSDPPVGGIIVVQNPRSVAITAITLKGGASQPSATLCGGFIGGAWVPAPTTTFRTIAVILPKTLRTLEREQLLRPEGVRTRATLEVLTPVPLQTAGEGQAQVADVLTWRGVDYQVQETTVWDQGPLKHYESLAVKIEQES